MDPDLSQEAATGRSPKRGGARPGRRRYPIEPLARAIGVTLGRVGGHQPDAPNEGLETLANRCGISHRRAQRWHQFGVPDRYSDQAALATSLPYSDCCTRCRDATGDLPVPTPPIRLERDGNRLTATYSCHICRATWRCWWHVDAPLYV